MSRKLTTEEFVLRARQVHGDKYYYNKVNYRSTDTPVIITCPTHGDFSQEPRGHLWGSGCPECYYDKAGEYSKLTTKQFIERSIIVHGNKYDYSKVIYNNMHEKVVIGCNVHGNFKQTPNSHLHGSGCFKCGKDCIAHQFTLTKDQFIEKSYKIHGDRYSYDLADYKGQDIPVVIICSEHGAFLQKPQHHFIGHGCPKCAYSISKGESELFDWALNLGIAVESRNKKILQGKELDIFFPENKLAIEYNGLYAHSSAHATKDLKTKHLYKTELCDKLGIRLIQFWDSEWQSKKKDCKNLIISALHNNNELEIRCLKKLNGISYVDSSNIILDRRLSNGASL